MFSVGPGFFSNIILICTKISAALPLTSVVFSVAHEKSRIKNTFLLLSWERAVVLNLKGYDDGV
jgi:hypothetical protein